MAVEQDTSTHDRSAQEIAIHELADKFGITEEEVANLYRRTFEHLSNGAVIKDYLAVLVTHEVWDILRQKTNIKFIFLSLLVGHTAQRRPLSTDRNIDTKDVTKKTH